MESSRSRGTKPSLFYRDLASPISSVHRAGSAAAAGRLPSPGAAGHPAATSPLWKDGASSLSDPPPPPFFTLDDRIDFSPEPGLPSDVPGTPRTPPSRGTPPPTSSSPLQLSWGEKGAGSEAALASSSWWSPVRSADEKGKGSPVDGVVQSGPLMLPPPPGEVAAPPEDRDTAVEQQERPDGGEWVTVYGFPPAEANLVIREFEKYGTILEHIAGSREANWIHILYQSRYDARKVLARDSVQINNVLMVGVKQVDPWQQRILMEKVSGGGIARTSGFMVSTRPYDLQKSKTIGTGRSSSSSSDGGAHSTGAVALPSRSVVSKLVDLVFGI